MPYMTLQTAAEHTLIDVDQLVDYPWVTVTVSRYTDGVRYDLTCCEDTEADDYHLFYNNILPPNSVCIGVEETETLPDTQWERTGSWWAME